MILKALYDYYFRCKNIYGDEVPPLGFEKKTLEYVILISKEGKFLDILTEQDCIAPRAEPNKTGTQAPANVLWDSAKYVINYDGQKIDASQQNELCKMFVKIIDELLQDFPLDYRYKALNNFYINKEYLNIEKHPLANKIKKSKSISFMVDGQVVCAYSPELQDYIFRRNSKHSEDICLITGKKSHIVMTTGSTPLGIATNGKLVSFQKDHGYDSHGKTQCENAPISIEAEFAYTQAMKMLNTSKNKVIQKKKIKGQFVDDRILYFWSSATNKQLVEDVENPLYWMLPQIDNPDDVDSAITFFKDIKKKGIAKSISDVKYYFLELVPTTKGRIAVSFWSECSVSHFADIANQHFEDMNIASNYKLRFDAINMSNAVSILKKDENNLPTYERPSNLVDSVFRSILTGAPYPESLYNAALDRIRAEQVNYEKFNSSDDRDRNEKYRYHQRELERAAIIKAFLNRKSNNYKLKGMLDLNYDNIGYLCGRLFAVLQYTQEKANKKDKGEWKSDLRSKYMNAAMSTPATVFPAILANSNYYLDKLDKIGWIEKIKQEIIIQIEKKQSFPAILSVYDQGRFFVGYYQQRYALLNKEDNKQIEDN